MLVRIVVGTIVAIVALALAGVAWIAAMERQADAGRLVDRLAATAVPDPFELVEQWDRDGVTLLKPRPAEARRIYVAAGPVASVCDQVDDFYRQAQVELRTVFRSDDPEDWCGRTLLTSAGEIRLDVEAIHSWTEVPPRFDGRRDLVQVSYAAYGS